MSNCPWCNQDIYQAVMSEGATLRGIALDDVDELLFHAEHDEANDMKTVMRIRVQVRSLRCCGQCYLEECECPTEKPTPSPAQQFPPPALTYPQLALAILAALAALALVFAAQQL